METYGTVLGPSPAIILCCLSTRAFQVSTLVYSDRSQLTFFNLRKCSKCKYVCTTLVRSSSIEEQACRHTRCCRMVPYIGYVKTHFSVFAAIWEANKYEIVERQRARDVLSTAFTVQQYNSHKGEMSCWPFLALLEGLLALKALCGLQM